jgi:hypothetical protein
MKIFAATLVFYILLLSVIPVLSSFKVTGKKEQCQKTCCHLSKPCEKKSDNKKDKGCPQGQCSPFFGCTKMQIVIPTFAALTSKQIVLDEGNSFFVQSYVSTSLASVWHPPKVV